MSPVDLKKPPAEQDLLDQFTYLGGSPRRRRAAAESGGREAPGDSNKGCRVKSVWEDENTSGDRPMTFIEHGLVQGGQIILPKPLALPEGTEVVVHIEAVTQPAGRSSAESFTSLPFFAMWAGREDMADSAAWVRKEREQWHQRTTRRE